MAVRNFFYNFAATFIKDLKALPRWPSSVGREYYGKAPSIWVPTAVIPSDLITIHTQLLNYLKILVTLLLRFCLNVRTPCVS